MFSNQPWIKEFESLPPDDQSKVVDFIHALRARRTASISTEASPTLFDRVKDLAGIIKDGPSDLSTNPVYLKDYGS